MVGTLISQEHVTKARTALSHCGLHISQSADRHSVMLRHYQFVNPLE